MTVQAPADGGSAPRVWPEWRAIHATRTSWAEQAYEEFLATFDDDVRRHLGTRGHEVRVVLYGPTQVGKTTLILRLLGLSDEATREAQRVLRGGRSQGNSATASATRYRLTDHNAWSWSWGSDVQERLEGEEIKSRLAELRATLRGRVGSSLATVGLPRNFAMPSAPVPNMAIIDLPGIHGAEEHEREHVRGLASEYLPSADAVLLVGKADQLEFLQREAAELPGIDWRYAPQRFRVVLTHALTLATFRDFIRAGAGTPITFDALVEHYLAELATWKYPEDLLRPILFPLDFGDTWLTAQGTPEGSLAKGANERSFAALGATIADLGSPEVGIAQAFHAHRVAAALQAERADEVAAELAESQAGIARLDRRIGYAQAALASTEKRRLESGEYESELREALRRAPRSSEPDAGLGARLLEHAKGGRSRLQSSADSELDAALEARVSGWLHWAEDLGVDRGTIDSAAAQLRERRDARLHEARIAVSRAWHRGEWFARWTTYGSPEGAVQAVLDAQAKGLADLDDCARSLAAAVGDIAQQHAETRAEAARAGAVIGNRIRRLEGMRRDAERSREQLIWTLDTHREASERAQERAHEFSHLLGQRYEAEMREVTELLEEETDANQRGLLAMQALLTTRTYDRIRGGGE